VVETGNGCKQLFIQDTAPKLFFLPSHVEIAAAMQRIFAE
jgi:hypothetical protein